MNFFGFKFSSGNIILLILSACLILTLACNKQKVECYWTEDRIVIDGQRQDWNNIPFNYFEDENVALAFSNDSNNLYIVFSFNDPKWARSIVTQGLTLWLDSKGKKNKKFGVRYAGGPPMDSLMSKGGRFDQMFFRENDDDSITREDEITIIDKTQNREYALPIDGSSGPTVCFGTYNGIFTYEFAIPFKKGDALATGIDAAPGHAFSIGAEWGGFDRDKMKKMMGGMGGHGGGGRGGHGGGGMGGGGRGGMGRGRMQPPEAQEIWLTTVLATPPLADL